ncbi:MAG: hypothetical protein ACYCW6_26400, partial [Candidatus Xenobia bacterium]
MAVLADGMGGMQAGGLAAALAAAAIVSWVSEHPETELEPLLIGALHAANESVFQVLQGSGGAAVVVSASTRAGCVVGHAGDARAYQVLEDLQLRQLTTDDTIAGQLNKIGHKGDTRDASQQNLLQFVGTGSSFEPHVVRQTARVRALL